jgi:hypothetical protein
MNVSEKVLNCQSFLLNITVKVNTTSIGTIKPLSLEMIYNVTKYISTVESKFCDDCVFLNRTNLNRAMLDIPVATGCSNGSCKPNLKLEGILMDNKTERVVGLTENVTILYSIANLGESAYFPELKIEIPNSVKFLMVPSLCKSLSNSKISCKIRSVSLKHDEKELVNITLDVSEIQHREINISAVASSSGDEVDVRDNVDLISISFGERSLIDVER